MSFIKQSIKVCAAGLLLGASLAWAAPPKNAVYTEFGGNALAYSLNYERKLTTDDWSARIGLAYLGGRKNSTKAIPLMLTKLWGHKDSNHSFETALGALYVSKQKSAFDRQTKKFNKLKGSEHIYGTATMGYRYAPKTDGVIFRAGFTPLFSRDFVIPWLGVSVGYSF